jgi:uncharacterized protein YdeI (BOF family)
VVIDEDDLVEDGVALTEDLALEIAGEIDNSEWLQVGIDVVGVQ